MEIRVKETVSKTLRGLKNELTVMAKGSGNSLPRKLVEWGKWQAISLAPHDTGATKRAIQVINSPGGSAKLRLIRPTQNRPDPRNYHLWMHGIDSPAPNTKVDPKVVQANIESGDPKFMYTVAKQMREKALKDAEKRVKKYTK